MIEGAGGVEVPKALFYAGAGHGVRLMRSRRCIDDKWNLVIYC